MPLYRHIKSGELVLAPAESPEGIRLSGDSAWAEETETPDVDTPEPEPDADARPGRRARRSTPAGETAGEDTSGADDAAA